jgi:hypothetical protein
MIFTLEKKAFKDTFDDTSRFGKSSHSKREFIPKNKQDSDLLNTMLNSINSSKLFFILRSTKIIS